MPSLTNKLDIYVHKTPLCSPSSVLANKPNSTYLAALLLKLTYLAISLASTRNVGQLKKKCVEICNYHTAGSPSFQTFDVSVQYRLWNKSKNPCPCQMQISDLSASLGEAALSFPACACWHWPSTSFRDVWFPHEHGLLLYCVRHIKPTGLRLRMTCARIHFPQGAIVRVFILQTKLVNWTEVWIHLSSQSAFYVG